MNSRSNQQNQQNPSLYGVQLLDDLHTYFPQILYEPSRFTTVQGLLSYVRTQATRLNPYEIGLQRYRNQNNIQRAPYSMEENTSQRTIPRNPSRLSQNIRTSIRPRQNTQLLDPEMPSLIPSVISSVIPSVIPEYEPEIVESYEFILPSLVPPSTNPRTDTSILRAILGLINLGESLDPVIVRATQEHLDTKTILRAAQQSDESENCSICQEHYTEGQAIRCITSCTHKFHKECVDRWFERNVHCPICRHDIRE